MLLEPSWQIWMEKVSVRSENLKGHCQIPLIRPTLFGKMSEESPGKNVEWPKS